MKVAIFIALALAYVSCETLEEKWKKIVLKDDTKTSNKELLKTPKCLHLGICKLPIDWRLEYFGIFLCYNYPTGLVGQCLLPERTRRCNKYSIISCHPFPELAEAFFDLNLINPLVKSRSKLSNAFLVLKDGIKLKLNPASITQAQDIVLDQVMSPRHNPDSDNFVGSVLRSLRSLAENVIVFIGDRVQDVKEMIDQHDEPNSVPIGIAIESGGLQLSERDIVENMNRLMYELMNSKEKVFKPDPKCHSNNRLYGLFDPVPLSDIVLEEQGILRVSDPNECQLKTSIGRLFKERPFISPMENKVLSKSVLNTIDKLPNASLLDFVNDVRPRSPNSYSVKVFKVSEAFKTYFHDLSQNIEIDLSHHPEEEISGRQSKSSLRGLLKLKRKAILSALSFPIWMKSQVVQAVSKLKKKPKPTKIDVVENVKIKQCRLKSKENTCLNHITKLEEPCKTKDVKICENESDLALSGEDEAKVETESNPAFNGDDEAKVETESNPAFNGENGAKVEISFDGIDPRSLYTSSSSWPWFDLSKQLPRSCQCMSQYQIYLATGRIIDPASCTQAVPWCFVGWSSGCSDSSENFLVPELKFSNEACRNVNVLHPNWKFF